MQSALVSQGGELIAECYFRDRRSSDLVNVHSVTKSIVSALVGIAIGERFLALSTTVGQVLADRLPARGEEKAKITVEDLLTMKSGLAADGPYDIDEIADAGLPWVDGVLSAPFRSTPGASFAYSNGAAHVLSVLLAVAVGKPLALFAEEHLFGPLGITDYRWPTDPEGNPL
jgi:CubicO group peptidase (beta-lactamase class C family)